MSRRRAVQLLLFTVFIVVPLVEIYVLVQVGQVIGAWWTVGLLVLDSILGTWLIRREGSRAWRALQTTIQSGRTPGRELADGALILVGGTMMLAPGFVTDAFGILLILPVTRPMFRRLLSALAVRRVLGGTGGTNASRPGPGPAGPVVRGEVVDEGPDDRP
jgi:UPF0716 protein FxsA